MAKKYHQNATMLFWKRDGGKNIVVPQILIHKSSFCLSRCKHCIIFNQLTLVKTHPVNPNDYEKIKPSHQTTMSPRNYIL